VNVSRNKGGGVQQRKKGRRKKFQFLGRESRLVDQEKGEKKNFLSNREKRKRGESTGVFASGRGDGPRT